MKRGHALRSRVLHAQRMIGTVQPRHWPIASPSAVREVEARHHLPADEGKRKPERRRKRKPERLAPRSRGTHRRGQRDERWEGDRSRSWKAWGREQGRRYGQRTRPRADYAARASGEHSRRSRMKLDIRDRLRCAVPQHLLRVSDAAVRLAIKQGQREIPGLRIFEDSKAMIR